MSQTTRTTPATSPAKVAAASFIGTTVEYYDFFIYGTAAALVFPKLFFPNAGPLIGALLSFATLGVGFLARPVGGVVFGHFGDRVGRKKMLVISLVTMGLATTLMGPDAQLRRHRPRRADPAHPAPTGAGLRRRR
jgi:MFS family permease